MAGEFDFIDWIKSQSPASPAVQLGVGDDLAVLKWNAEDLLLVGVDQAIDGVHFDSAIHSPRQIARKVVNRNFSDCAAMGCLPAAIVATVALPRNYSLDRAKEFYRGLRDAADAQNCPLVGGDTASWDGKLVATVTVIGRSAGQKPVSRSGAKPGDAIFVTGPLGGSILGRHMDFSPRVELGRKIALLATAMIDVSDGLSRDLANLCKSSGVGAVLEAINVPIHADALELSRRDGRTALEHALHDGEDYELLFTTHVADAPGIRIGRIVAENGLWLEDFGARKNLEPRGYQHSLGG
jgi:thiamine-monophosphate kinase